MKKRLPKLRLLLVEFVENYYNPKRNYSLVDYKRQLVSKNADAEIN